MSKLLEWLGAISLFFGVWFAIVFRFAECSAFDRWMNLILVSPILLLAIFGLYSITVILYRVFTFNDCEYAAKELQQQIIEAKEDLKQKGYVF